MYINYRAAIHLNYTLGRELRLRVLAAAAVRRESMPGCVPPACLPACFVLHVSSKPWNQFHFVGPPFIATASRNLDLRAKNLNPLFHNHAIMLY